MAGLHSEMPETDAETNDCANGAPGFDGVAFNGSAAVVGGAALVGGDSVSLFHGDTSFLW